MQYKNHLIYINDIPVGDGAPCFITFEAGPTHEGFESAKRLAKYAKDSGGNAIKFQIFDPIKLVSDPDIPFSYQILRDKSTGEMETVTESLRDILIRRHLTRLEWKRIKEYCDEIGIAFFATACFNEDVDFLVEIGCQSIKIASADVNHIPFIRYAASSGLVIQLDTGMASIGEIELAVDAIREMKNDQIIIHHCPSGYPALLPSVNLNAIPMIKNLFRCPVAYSDHNVGWDIDIAALTLGANLVEKTITENRLTKSVEHVMSLEPSDMRRFVGAMRDIETALGNTRRTLSNEELKKRMLLRRSIHVCSDLSPGHILRECDIEYRRPGTGITPEKLSDVLNRKLLVRKLSGEQLSLVDLAV